MPSTELTPGNLHGIFADFRNILIDHTAGRSLEIELNRPTLIPSLKRILKFSDTERVKEIAHLLREGFDIELSVLIDLFLRMVQGQKDTIKIYGKISKSTYELERTLAEKLERTYQKMNDVQD